MAASSFDLDARMEESSKVTNEEKASEPVVLLEDC